MSSSSERIKVRQVRYENGGFYLTIDNIKGYFNFIDNIGTLDMIFFNDDQRDKYHQVWKEIFKIINDGNGSSVKWGHLGSLDPTPANTIFSIITIYSIIWDTLNQTL